MMTDEQKLEKKFFTEYGLPLASACKDLCRATSLRHKKAAAKAVTDFMLVYQKKQQEWLKASRSEEN